MPAHADPMDFLQFEPPGETDRRGWTAAEAQCLKFPERFVQKCRDYNEVLKGLEQVETERARFFHFVVRNLLDVVDNCEAALAEEAEPTSAAGNRGAADEAAVDPEEEQPEETPAVADADQAGDERDAGERPEPPGAALVEGEQVEAVGLASVHRSILYLLEELGVRRVDLLGRTYEDVIVGGRKIEDPFEVLESTQTGKASERRVSRVVADLWIDADGRILRRGKVIC